MRTGNTAIAMPRRRPIIRLGQSNIAGGYTRASTALPRLQHPQDAIRVHRIYSGTPVWENVPWHRVAPWPDATRGFDVMNWGIDLADALLGAGHHPAFIDYCIGGTSTAYWTPGSVGSAYPTLIAWVQAWLADLTLPLDPVCIFYQGESGTGDAVDWDDHMAAIAAGLRTDLACATMGIVVVRIPPTSAMGAAMIPYQNAYVSADARARIAYNDLATYDNTLGPPADVHIDLASARRLAVGPDAAGAVRSVLTCLRELL